MARPRVTAKPTIVRIEIVLVDVEPLVRRVVEVPGETSLAVLHEVVQGAMGWENSRLHGFDIDGVRYGLPDPDWDTGTLDEAGAKLLPVLAAGDDASYVYDFGDNWHHLLVVDAVTAPEPGVRYPRCVEGQGACPPEDVGATRGQCYGTKTSVEASSDKQDFVPGQRGPQWPAQSDPLPR